MFNEKSEFLDQSTLIDVDSTVVSSVLKRVYLWMTFALVISGLTAMYVVESQPILELIFSSEHSILVLFLAQLGVVWFYPLASTNFHLVLQHYCLSCTQFLRV